MAHADTEKLLDRVRKLLALAGSPNVHEAALAAARAQALIEEHRLHAALAAEEAAEAEPVDSGAGAPLEVTRRPRKWKGVLAARLAEVNGCVAYTVVDGREERLLLAGRADDRAAVAAIWDWLVQRLEWASATEGAGRDRAWHEAFRVGAAEVVARRLAEARQAARDGLAQGAGAAALAVVDARLTTRQAAVDRFVAERLRLKPGRGMSLDARALAAGRAAGARLPLGPSDR
jgi:hypothetical protein